MVVSAVRKLAYQFGQKLLPRKGKFESLYYALDLNDPCNGEDFNMAEPVAYIEPSKASPNADAIYVSPTGDDSAAGTEAAPLKTIQAGFDKAAAAKSTSLVLRGGTYYLTSAVNVNSKHSGIAVTAYNDEEPVISGGKKLTTEWKPYDVSNGTASWTTKVFFYFFQS